MTAKGISGGIERLISQQKTDNNISTQLSKQWKDIRNRIDVILLSNNALRTTEVRQQCIALDSMNYDERVDYITSNWGALHLNRVLPLLQQLVTIEGQLAKTTQ